jgi:hypothetical protein
VLHHPTQTPRLRELFDLKMVGIMTCVAVTGIMSCDLVNRAFDKRLLPQHAEVAPETWQPHTKTTLILTLKTQDAERHTCATELVANNGALRCEYENAKRKTPRTNRPADDNLGDVLQPYRVAPGNHPLLLSGVWQTPEVAYRRHLEPSRDRRKDQQQTFYAQCEVEFFERFSSVDVRYEFGKTWTNLKDVSTGHATRCTILKDPEAPSI